MSKFLVVISPNEAAAYEGQRALDGLHSEGSITVYATAVIARAADGNIAVRKAEDAPVMTAVGALAGGLAGVLAGPAGWALGTSAGALMGSFGDLFSLGINADFVDEVSKQVEPGKAVLLADVDEEWVTPVDTRMEALGGTVHRQWRADFEDAQWQKDIERDEAEWEALKAETEAAVGEAKVKLQAKTDAAKAKLDASKRTFKERQAERDAERQARLEKLKAQAGAAHAEHKAKVEDRKARFSAQIEDQKAKLRELAA